MTEITKIQEHEDLEERLYISANVEFDTDGATFSGLPELDVEVKVKKKQDRIEQRDDARRKSNNELF